MKKLNISYFYTKQKKFCYRTKKLGMRYEILSKIQFERHEYIASKDENLFMHKLNGKNVRFLIKVLKL